MLRYRTEDAGAVDGLTGHEGAFLACSFWMADCLYLIGRYDDAHAMFDRLIGLRNDLGLLAEEYDVRAGRQVGNFPQAFSHVSLVNAAYNLSGHPAMGEQIVADEHLLRATVGRRWGAGRDRCTGWPRRAGPGQPDSRNTRSPDTDTARRPRPRDPKRRRTR